MYIQREKEMAKRTAKFYAKNEYELMKELGLKATKNSGARWIEKEDGQNEHVIAQLKSTDKNSISLKLLDLEKLRKNAYISKKLPLFIIQFLKSDDRYIICKYEDLPEIAKYIETGEYKNDNEIIDIVEETKPTIIKKIKNSKKAREAFWKEKEKQWKK